jgi:hypothetical protein
LLARRSSESESIKWFDDLSPTLAGPLRLFEFLVQSVISARRVREQIQTENVISNKK